MHAAVVGARVHELPTATEDKSNTAQQTRATGTARDGGVVHAITKTEPMTNEKTSNCHANCPSISYHVFR